MIEMYKGIVNSPETTITNNISNSDTIIHVLDETRVPTDLPNLMTLGTGTGAETIKVLSISGNALTVERGFQGVAKAWNAGTVIVRNFTEYDYEALRQNVGKLDNEKVDKSQVLTNVPANAIFTDTVDADGISYDNQESELNSTDVQGAIDEVNDDLAAHKADYIRQPAFATTTGTANTYAVTLDPVLTAYASGVAIAIKVNVSNTGASTININGLGAKAIVDSKGNALTANKLLANSVYSLRYNGTNFILQGEGASGNALASDLLSGKTASTDAGDIVGTMPNRTGHVNAQSSSISGTTLRFRPQEGYYSGTSDNSVQLSNANFIANNIRSGVNLFGVTGNMLEGAKLKRIQYGTYTGVEIPADSSITISIPISVDLTKSFLVFNKGYLIRAR